MNLHDLMMQGWNSMTMTRTITQIVVPVPRFPDILLQLLPALLVWHLLYPNNSVACLCCHLPSCKRFAEVLPLWGTNNSFSSCIILQAEPVSGTHTGLCMNVWGPALRPLEVPWRHFLVIVSVTYTCSATSNGFHHSLPLLRADSEFVLVECCSFFSPSLFKWWVSLCPCGSFLSSCLLVWPLCGAA